MNFIESIKRSLSQYVIFSGRTARSEYWWFVLFVVVASVILSLADAWFLGVEPETGKSRQVLAPIFQLAVAIPVLAAGWRRMHDTGRPGWYLLLPAALSITTAFALFGGIAMFSVLERVLSDPDELRGAAAILGVSGLVAFGGLQLLLSMLMLWWLTRPSQASGNKYGPAHSY